MLIVGTRSRRDFLRLGASSIAGAVAIAALPTLAGAAGHSAGVPTPARGRKRNRFKSIDDALAAGVANGAVAGIVGLAADSRRAVYEGAFGKRDLASSVSMTPDTVFWLLSMTKAITATACMQLVERGKLSLDQPASQVLPELAAPMVLEGFDASGRPRVRPAKRAITPRHLLTHTSGFTYSNWSDRLPQYERATGMADIAESKNGAFAAPLEFDPGERWHYGIGMDWVGKLVEAVSKSKFWPDTCIFVVEDDPQAGFDHVDGHRSVCWVVSPYTKRGAIVYGSSWPLKLSEQLMCPKYPRSS